MATQVIKTIRASGGDFTTLSAWEAAIPADIVALDEQWIAECYDDWPAGLVDLLVVSGHTTDATRNIVIRAASGSEAGGLLDNGFRITNNSWSSVTVTIKNTYVELYNIGIVSTGGSASAKAFLSDSKPNQIVAGCVFSRSTRTNGSCCEVGHSSNTHDIYNCLVFGGSTGFSSFYSANFYNCVAVNVNGKGFSDSSDTYQKIFNNNIAFGCNTGFSFKANAAHDYNASDDLTATGTNSSTGITSADFADAANDDYHLSASSNLIGQGVNLYTEFTDDIDGDTRPASGAWDIGIDHYVASGGTSPVDLAAASQAAAEASGGLTLQAPVSASAINLTSANGTLSTAINLAGLAASISTTTSDIEANISLSVSALSQSLASAGLDINALMATQADAEAKGDATLSATGADTELSASAAAAADTDAQITLQIELAGQAIAETLAQSELSTGQALTATGASDASASGALVLDVPVTAAAASQVTGQGGLNASLPVTATSAAASQAFGGLNVSASLSASALANALMQAGLSAASIGSLDAAASSQAQAQGVIQLDIPLSVAALSNAYAQGLLVQGGMIAAAGRHTATAVPGHYTVTAIQRHYSVCA